MHQPFELNWWREHIPKGHLDDGQFLPFVKEIRDWIEPTGHVLDIGCGPRPFFPPCTAIDPLAGEYLRMTPPEWWAEVTVHSQAAEVAIPGLKADTIICWNALDHTIGWREILDRMVEYANPGARIALSTDFWPPFDGHPGYERDEFMSEMDKRFSVVKSREPFGRALALLMTVV